MDSNVMDRTGSVDRIQTTTRIFCWLVGEVPEKYRAIQALDHPQLIDLPALRTLISKAIEEDYYPGREDELADPQIAVTRSWLLGALARLAAGSEEATALVIRHLDKEHEPYRWARYWALEGLIRGGNPKTQLMAKKVAENDHDQLVALLGTAYLGSLNDQKAVAMVQKALKDPERQWYALRALRVTPLAPTVPHICQMVNTGSYTDATYDAIMALGAVPAGWKEHAEMAAHSLDACIRKVRHHRWMDGMRIAAIASLGWLNSESSTPELLKELTDDNPAVVREAARSIEKTLGLKPAVLRELC